MCRIDDANDLVGRWLAEPHKRTARKAHQCLDCGRTIDPGERYSTGTWIDGEGHGLFTPKMCAHCITAGGWLLEVCGGHLWPGVVEELTEHWNDEPEYRSIGLGRLVLSARHHWRRRGQLIPLDTVADWVDDALNHAPALSGPAHGTEATT